MLRSIACVLLLLGPGLGCATQRTDPGSARAVRAVSNLLHPPFSSRDAAGRVVGLEPDLLAAAAAQLGRSVHWDELSFSELLTAVERGSADVAASTIGITDERRECVAFSRPYFETTIVALVRTGAGEPARLDDLQGRRIVTERGTTTVAAAQARIPGAVRVFERPDERTWAELLRAGEVDAVIIDRSHATTFMDQAGESFAVLDEPLQTERFAFALPKDSHALRAALDAAILDYEREERNPAR